MFLKSVLGKGGADRKQRVIVFNRVVYPVLTAHDLLSTRSHQQALEDLAKLANLPGEHYGVLYEDLIQQFANYVQILPKGNRDSIASLLNEGIQRATFALKMHREKSEDPHNHLQAYVVFSAALLFEVGKVIDDRKVVVCDQSGKFIANWMPLKGPIGGIGKYYKVREMPDMPAQYHTGITPLIARQIMPTVGFEWIAEHPKMLDAWLAMLVGREPASRGFVYILEVIKEWHKLSTENQRFFFPEPPFESFEPRETADGEAFMAWLNQCIADGTLSVNKADSLLHMTKAGLFLQAPAIFEKYCATIGKQATHWTVVQRQFNVLGVTKFNGDDIKYSQYYAVDNHLDGSGLSARKSGVFSHQNLGSTPAAGSVAQRFQAAKAKQAQTGQIIKEGLVLRNAEYVFGHSPLPPVSALLKPVTVDPVLYNALPGIREAAFNRLPPLFADSPSPGSPASDPGGLGGTGT